MTKDASDERILQAAARVFREKGYAAATTRDIASAAGFLLGSLTYRYPSKHEILATVAERGMAKSLDICRKAVADTSDPVQAIRRIFSTHFRILTREDDSIYVLLYEWRALTGEARASIVRQRDEYEAIWDGLLQDAAKSGAISAAVDLRMLRILFLSAANWSPQWFDSKDRHSPDQVADEFFTLIWNGVTGVPIGE